ncbi:MAG: SH3 domain-containing protein [Clostridia bacterium]|nr:SH3 domain-containing protein [Clostridia bacterium]
MRIRKITMMLLALVLLIASVPAFDLPALAAKMPYRIYVDLTNQIVTIYSNETDEVVRQMLCSSGAKDATPTGTFTMPAKERDEERTEWFHFNAFGGYARYASRIHWDVMFHSLLYNKPKMTALDKQSVLDYGKAVSHGCIRMRWQDAEFIAKKCLPGTKVKIYKSGEVDNDLRTLLFQASYTNENGQSYKEYLGIPDQPGVMGRYSEGEDVRDLQMRLRDLGLYTEEISGVYQVPTVTAVRQAQAMMGMEQTGVATIEFQKALYAGDAPSAMNVTITEGMSGPLVRSLQENLAALELYTGEIDSIYDVDVIEAVKVFQGAYGCTVDGVATPTLQKAIYYEAGRLRKMFESEGGYSLEKVDEEIYMGTINCELGVRLREEASTTSDKKGLLRLGDVVVAIERVGDWSRVQKGKNSGYVMNKYVDFYPQTISSLKYVSQSGSSEYTIGYTAQDYLSGADRPADIFLDYLTSGGSLDSYNDLVEYATVSTDNDDVTLNLREAPNTDSDILDVLKNGAQVRVLTHSEEWSQVSCNGATGYLLNRYLEFWTGGEDALQEKEDEDEPVIVEEVDQIEHAVVDCDSAKKAAVYAEDSADAKVLGGLANGTKVEVLQTRDGWSRISLQGHEGYMREQDLKFLVEGVEA